MRRMRASGDSPEPGPIRSFEQLYERYYDRMVNFLCFLGFPREEARDLSQDIFLRVFQHMDAYRGEAEWKFLEVTARHHAANVIRGRHAKKREALAVSMEEGAAVLDPAMPADQRLERREQRIQQQRELRAAIRELPPGMREAFLLRVRGRKYKDIQSILGISMDAVKARIREARVRLTERLSEEPPEDDHDPEE
jgi:RNA polymerase sigma-70 factor, ECF subfamily